MSDCSDLQQVNDLHNSHPDENQFDLDLIDPPPTKGYRFYWILFLSNILPQMGKREIGR